MNPSIHTDISPVFETAKQSVTFNIPKTPKISKKDFYCTKFELKISWSFLLQHIWKAFFFFSKFALKFSLCRNSTLVKIGVYQNNMQNMKKKKQKIQLEHGTYPCGTDDKCIRIWINMEIWWKYYFLRNSSKENSYFIKSGILWFISFFQTLKIRNIFDEDDNIAIWFCYNLLWIIWN